MNHIWAIAKKELRGYFSSAVAVIFLAAFLGVVLYLFFWQEKFFSRGVADVRPMFSWLPILLIFLVSALTMRLWSEEHKVGTIELLLTLPVPTWKLVLGKFVAGFLLVALALGMTIGLPITVAILGDIDVGPVLGGYFATLLLAGAYLAIGLCVSASTDNQIVSLVLTALFCALLYAPGAEAVSGDAGYGLGEILRKLGTGSRFESIARGVVDVRDLVYWLGLILFFLMLNVVILKARRWSAGARAARHRRDARLAVLLVGLNVIALNLWLAPIGAARLDLTEDREYSLSDATKQIMRGLDEPLLIRAYISDENHPKLAHLVVQIRDRLTEYKRIGGRNVRLEFIDPTDNEELRTEAARYNIVARPFMIRDHREQKITNSYFDILFVYGGSEFEVLNWSDLVEVVPTSTGDVVLQLRNLEYDVTRTIKKLVTGFRSVETLLATMQQKGEIGLIVTPDLLKPEKAQSVAVIEKSARALAERSQGKLTFEKEIPAIKTEADVQAIADRWGAVPSMRVLTPNGVMPAYLELVLRVGKTRIVVDLSDLSEPALKKALENALERTAPGFIKTIGMIVPKAVPIPGAMPHLPPQGSRPPQGFGALARILEESFDVMQIPEQTKVIDDDVDVLIVAGPENLEADTARAIDQFLMRNGTVIVLAGRFRYQPDGDSPLSVAPIESGIDQLLEHYGVTVGKQLIGDTKNEALPLPVPRAGGRPDVVRTAYPYFVHIDREDMTSGHPATAGLASAVFLWPASVTAADNVKKRSEILFRSSSEAWLAADPEAATPDFAKNPKGFDTPNAGLGEHPLAIAISGPFTSYFAKAAKQRAEEGNASSERLLESSSADARLIVIGSSDFASDLNNALIESEEIRLDSAKGNFIFLRNLIDWAMQDTDLLSIRGRGLYRRGLKVEADTAERWQYLNYGFAAAALLLVFGVGALRRRAMVPAITIRKGESA